MQAWVYQNTATNIPGISDALHVPQPRGYSYESDGSFVHIYGMTSDLWVLSTGLTVWQSASNSDHLAWTERIFGATEAKPLRSIPSEAIEGVWRPGLIGFSQTRQALGSIPHVQNKAEQGLRILLEKLDEILIFIEPSPTGLESYGHKTRELLILACTEIENSFVQYMRMAGASPAGRTFTTADYIRLLSPLHLAEFEIEFKPLSLRMRPFWDWNATQPTQSLGWYDAYNKTKHDREHHFAVATLKHCLLAIAAAIILFGVRYSPLVLEHGQSSLSSLYRQHFTVGLVNPDPASFYVPHIVVPADWSRPTLSWGAMEQHVRAWRTRPLIL